VTETKPASPSLNNKKNVQDKPIKANSRLYNKIEQDATLFHEPERDSTPFLSRAKSFGFAKVLTMRAGSLPVSLSVPNLGQKHSLFYLTVAQIFNLWIFQIGWL